MDGWQNIKDFQALLQIFGKRLNAQWLHAIRNPLILENWLSSEGAVKKWGAMREILSSSSLDAKVELPKIKCDILIYCSSDKPSVQPALSWLAQRLGNKGVSTLLWSPKKLICFPDAHVDPIQEVLKLKKLFSCSERLAAILDIPFCSLLAAYVLVRAKLSKSPVAVRLTARPRRLFAELMMARHSLRVMKKITRHFRPRFVLTNGEQTPLGLAITIAAKEQGIRVAWFFNEWPTPQMLPIVSNELWVWNAATVAALESLTQGKGVKPRLEIVGMAQLDCMVEQAATNEVLPTKIASNKCFLFISEHIPNYAHHNSQATENALAWIAEAAVHAPDWYFVIKPRPYHTAAPIPGEHHIKGIRNVLVLRDGSTMSELLAAPEIKVFAALSSSALLLAAATGRQAMRLAVTDYPYPLHPLDEVTVRINTVSELLSALERPPTKFGSREFPNRGQVLDRMESLCLQHINHTTM